MSLLKSIVRKLPAQPFVITMAIVAGSIHTTITRGSESVPSLNFLAIKELPDKIVQYLRAQTEIESGVYRLPFPSAKRLIRELRIPELAEIVKIKAIAVEALKPIPLPDNFRVQWHFDTKRHVLMRRLINADGYAGGGCFYLGTQIWRLEEKLSPQMLTWLGKAEIAGDQLVTFLEQGLNSNPSPYFECDLKVTRKFNARLEIVKMLNSSIDVNLVTNQSVFQPDLLAIHGNPDDLYSGDMLFPDWGKLLHGQMLAIACSSTLTSLDGEALADFLYTHGADFSVLGVSEALLVQLQKRYPIYDGATLPLTWKITHHSIEGIGRYWATPCLSSENGNLPIDMLGGKLETGARFYPIRSGWIAFTPAFRARYAAWRAKKLHPISLLPQEVLGTRLDRLKQIRLAPPSISVNTPASEERDQAVEFFEAMRRQGLPAVVYGLQNEIDDILAQVCKQLLQDNPKARILWILPRRRREAAVEILERAGIPVAQTSDTLEGRITLLSPDVAPSQNINWTLIIFRNLDLIASSETQNRLYASLARNWAIGTFYHPTWAENTAQAGNLLRVLGLGPDDLMAFQRYCMRKFSTQTDEPSARLASPFKKLMIGEETTNITAAVPIPKPTQALQPEIKDVFRPSFAQTWTSASSDTSFLASAQRYAEQTASPTEFIPFKMYFPTYRVMTSVQGHWYFYWRGEVRKQNYLHTDLSYIFLHVYEVIHLVGFDNTFKALEHLTNLWLHYRTAYPQLDSYLVDWLADFHIVYHLRSTALEWYARAFEVGNVDIETNIALEAWLTTGEDLTTIPDALLDKLSFYNYRKSKFYRQSHTTENSLDSQYREALHLISTHIQRQTGKSLLEHFRPTDYVSIQRKPFAGAIYEGPREEIVVATLPDWTQSDGLQESITSVIKYTENRLRRQRNFKGVIQDAALPSAWATILDAAFPVVAMPPKPTGRKRKYSRAQEETFSPKMTPLEVDADLTIDFQQVDDLLASAQMIQDLLAIDESGVEPNIEIEADTDDDGITSELVIAFDTERPSDTPPHLLTDLQEVAQILSGDSHAVALLRFLQQQNWIAQEYEAQHIVPNEFLSEIMYRVNTRALDILGDKLIFIDDNQVTVVEDYQDEVEHLLTHILDPVDTNRDIPPTVTVPETQTTSFQGIEELTPEWAAFVQRLQPHHWEILNVLLNGQNVVLRLDSIARDADSMVSLMINDINNIALSAIGDIVIDSTVEPPVIEEEDLDDLRALNSWVQEHRLQES